MVCPKCGSKNVTLQDYDTNSYWLMNSKSKLGFFLAWLMRSTYESEYGEECVCCDCGNRWHAKGAALQQKRKELLTPYLGTEVKAPNGRKVQIQEQELVLRYPNGRIYRVDYSELAGVSFQRSIGPLYGWLTIRDRIHAKRRMPRNFEQARGDRHTVFCDFADENECYHIYLALQKIVEENKKAGLI